MRWLKRGLIFNADGERPWMQTHAQLPVGDLLSDRLLRIYFSSRDGEGRSRIGSLDVDPDDPARILRLPEEPILPLGRLGTFDDNGMMPSCIVEHEGRKNLYYIGWNPQVTVSYRLAIGLAVSDDGGETWHRHADGPVSDRSLDEPYFNTAPWVLVEDGLWRMWYISCTGWELINGWPEPSYHVKYAESDDGIHWRKTGRVCIDYDAETRAIGRPCVFRHDGLYRMLFSWRGTSDYRTDPAQSYRLGYAESADGLAWTRKDGAAGIARSESGWDSEMMEYCSIFDHRGRKRMLYNGNGFGRSGFGYAVLEDDRDSDD